MKLRITLGVVALAACASAVAQAPDRAALQAAARTACDAEIKSMCSDKQGGQVFACLRQNVDKASSDCKDALAKVPAGRRGGAGAAPAPAAPPQ
jgi:hypothetical protein